MNNINNSLLKQHSISPLHEIHYRGQTQVSSTTHFDTTSSDNDFILSSAASFPWADDQHSGLPGNFEEQSASVLASKMSQHQISNGAAKDLVVHQQLLLSRSLAAASGLCSPIGEDAGFLPMPHFHHDDVVAVPSSFKSSNPANDASIKALVDVFTKSVCQTPNQPPQFQHPQDQNFGAPKAAALGMSQPTASGGGTAAQPRQRVRARRGQATDPHSIAERLRRERISERMRALQELVPNANKTDKASMLGEIIDYVKFLQHQAKVLSMSRLGSAAGVTPLVADINSEGRNSDGRQMVSPSISTDGMTVTESQVLKLMEDDMGSAMQYLQGKGLCLMPISLTTAISTSTCHFGNPLATGPSNNPLLNGKAGGPTSPRISALTVKSAAIDGGGDGEPSLKSAISVSKP